MKEVKIDPSIPKKLRDIADTIEDFFIYASLQDYPVKFESSKELDISVERISSDLFEDEEIIEKIGLDIDKLRKVLVDNMGPMDKLAKAIFGFKDDLLLLDVQVLSHEERIIEAIRARLNNDIITNLLLSKYGLNEDGLSFDDIVKYYRMSFEEARQIVAQALRELRHPVFSNYFRYVARSSQKRMKMPSELFKMLNYMEYKDIETKNSELEKEIKLLKSEIVSLKNSDRPIITLEEVGLSVRAYNILIRSGHDTFSSLCSITEEEFMNKRGLGKKTAEEIKKAMLKYSITFYE